MRKPIVIAVLTISVAAAALAQQAAPEWSPYRSAEGKYSILFPGKPALSSQEITLADGVKATQYMAITTAGGAAYSVMHTSGIRAYDFNKGRDSILANINARLLSERNVSLGGHPGREMKANGEVRGRRFFTAIRVYHVRNIAYVLQYIQPMPAGPEIPANAQKCFDSFRVTTR